VCVGDEGGGGTMERGGGGVQGLPMAIIYRPEERAVPARIWR
jgi:hypothetical protein